MPVAPQQAGLGFPGLRSVSTAEFRRVLSSTSPLFLPGGRIMDGVKTRDPGNTPNIDSIRAGLVLGRVTASPNRYANAFIGVTTGALAPGGTTITVSAASATEIVRRIGATGTITLTGPSAASLTRLTQDTRQVTLTYSAVNTTTGVVTLTGVGANMVQRVKLNIASTAGNLQLTVQKPDLTWVTTANIAWSATDATYLASINSALDTATGVVGGIVATAISAVDTDLGVELTYAGTGYAGKTWGLASVAVYPTSSTSSVVSVVTNALQGAFIAGSFVGDTDGSQTPVIILPDGPCVPVADTVNTNGVTNIQFPQVPVAAIVDTALVIDYPTDSGLIAWLKSQFNTPANGLSYTFNDEI